MYLNWHSMMVLINNIKNPSIETSTSMPKYIPNFSVVLALLVLVGCTTLATNQNWPADLPQRKIFIDKFLSNRQINVAESEVIESHLIWIVRFYQGTILFPNGWNRISERFIDSIDKPKDKRKMAVRLRALGISIANEWAQENNLRRINNTHVAAWGSALRTAAELADQKDFVAKVEGDVKALINGALEAEKIRYERYYPSEDYDNF
ncbi:MAG: hypothetical protein ACI9OI_001540 [Chitinophagales bacterium]|jgi:hypothetical protein